MAEKGHPLGEIAAVCKKAAGEMGRLLSCLNVVLLLQSWSYNWRGKICNNVTMNNFIEPFVKLLI